MLVGHQHSYERSCPAVNGSCAADGVSGTTHLVVGSAGANHEKGAFSPQLGNFSVKHVDDYGFIRLNVTRDSMKIGLHTHAGPRLCQGWPSLGFGSLATMALGARL